MLANRIVGAFLFRRQVYADVEKDASFTGAAWAVVAVVTFLSQLGARCESEPNDLVDRRVDRHVDFIGWLCDRRFGDRSGWKIRLQCRSQL